MKVKELIEKLSEFNEDLKVVRWVGDNDRTILEFDEITTVGIDNEVTGILLPKPKVETVVVIS